ncbi:hypothetical protein D3C78_1387640 [compost metagenome]
MGGIEHAHHALVAGEQAGYAARGGRVDREQRAGHVDHALQRAVARHVDAVVVARAEVDGGELAVLELGRQGRISADQRARRIMVALGLENLVAGDGAELAHGAVHGAIQRGQGLRAHASAQTAREKSVESVVARGIGVGGFGHVDTVAGNEALDHPRRQPAAPQMGQSAHHSCQRLLGQ